jgi:DNA-binding CsgD family transcriptional regulator
MTDTEVVKLEGLGLTPREAEVLAWVAQGKSNGVIGTILGISPRTVQKHLERTFNKLGVESRTAAAAHALTFVWADARVVQIQ